MRLSIDDALARTLDIWSEAAKFLWEFDRNRLVPGKHYVISPQSRTDHHSDDAARVPLFEHFSDEVWEIDSFRLFRKLLDNYVVTQGVPERVSPEEKMEEDTFLECICETDCIKFLFQWLKGNACKVGSSMDEFKSVLHDFWFGMHDRGRGRDSSAFEHVFCGEIDGDEVKGLHNYIQVYIEEQRGNFDYMGYVDFKGDLLDKAPLSNQQILMIRFQWFGCLKSVSSMFIGTSPEFEIALYTLCFFNLPELQSPDRCLGLGPYGVKINCYCVDGHLTTAFPSLLSVEEDILEEDHSQRKEFNENDYHGNESEGDQLERVDAAVLHDSEEFPPLG
eukprot:TRINITY_DN70642_c0_g1_i1.p2 TRINITY_DN70642_c0_g1~~TRINITY_DN70642_c0_g1_i1.p2  ORF type:complete len:334 (-),score=49.22 TRINITY_DN70642_c0_g1_i1:2567-3568(-)